VQVAAHTIGLALAAAVYPTILAGVIVILGQPDPRRLLVGFLLGGMTMSIAAGIVLVGAFEQSDDAVDLHNTTRPVADIVFGLVSLALAWAVWTGRTARVTALRGPREPRVGAPSWTQRVLGRGSLWLAIVAGALLNLPGIWYLAALTDIAELGSASSQLVWIVVFNLIMFLLVEVPLLMFILDEDDARQRVTDFGAWAHAHAREIGSVLALVVGVFLTAKGVFLALE